MEIYRLKHKPTGLYYQPLKNRYSQGTHLSKKGKIYQSKSNVLNGDSDTITICISKNQYNKHKELFDLLGAYNYRGYGSYNLKCLKSDFEIEYITNI